MIGSDGPPAAPVGPQPGDDAATTIRALAASDPGRVLLEVAERHVTARELDTAVERVATRLVRDLVTNDVGHPAVGLRMEGERKSCGPQFSLCSGLA